MGNETHIYQIQPDLAHCYQNSDQQPTTTLDSRHSSRNLIPMVRLLSTCRFSQRSQKEDKAKVSQSLLGLSDNLSNIRSHVLAMDPLLKIRKALALVTHEKMQLSHIFRGSSSSMPRRVTLNGLSKIETTTTPTLLSIRIKTHLLPLQNQDPPSHHNLCITSQERG